VATTPSSRFLKPQRVLDVARAEPTEYIETLHSQAEPLSSPLTRPLDWSVAELDKLLSDIDLPDNQGGFDFISGQTSPDVTPSFVPLNDAEVSELLADVDTVHVRMRKNAGIIQHRDQLLMHNASARPMDVEEDTSTSPPHTPSPSGGGGPQLPSFSVQPTNVSSRKGLNSPTKQIKRCSQMKAMRRNRDKMVWTAICVMDFRQYKCAEKVNAKNHAKTVFKKRLKNPNNKIIDRAIVSADGRPSVLRWREVELTGNTTYTTAWLETSTAKKRQLRLVVTNHTTDSSRWWSAVESAGADTKILKDDDAATFVHSTIVESNLGCIWFGPRS